ncbi:MAG: hypothetical protein EZS28_005725 [Streblomastix strix]|uniref:Uncharacterized protein n=1 Tax=Streblomastix strix TaxID=222440 RepID=A0A5J4WW66_9EUKA|nr:MAG: hypothetical protein EZS28_005725 [Streblomastix strix]
MKPDAKQARPISCPINPQGVAKLEPTPTLQINSHLCMSGEKMQIQPKLQRKSQQNSPKATVPVQDP